MSEKPKRIGDPRSFMFDGAAWTVEEREPEKMELAPHLSILYFRSGRQRRWAPHPRSLLRMLETRDLAQLLQEARRIPDPSEPTAPASS